MATASLNKQLTEKHKQDETRRQPHSTWLNSYTGYRFMNFANSINTKYGQNIFGPIRIVFENV
jgi:hypothetical protein